MKFIPVGFQPNALVSGEETIWVANHGDGTVSQLDLDGKLLSTVKSGEEPIALVFDGTSIWVAQRTGSITRIDP